MKKFFYLASLALIALSSCSSDEIKVAEEEAEASNELVPIVLGLGNPTMTVSTRGTGTIGGTASETNHWQGERLRVLMTQIPDDVYPTFGYTYRVDNGITTELFDNSFYCLPDESQASETGAAYLTLKGVDTRYYPATGSSNFFAYYIDDAFTDETLAGTDAQTTVLGTDAATVTKDATTAEGMAYKYVDFKLNGTQDLMAGMAAHQGGFVGFSAQSARKNIHPQITMDHLLTRLTFSVVAGDVNANGVTVDSVKVVSKGRGALTVAYDSNTPQPADSLIIWQDSVASFSLMERAKDAEDAYIYLDASGEKTALQALTSYTFNLDGGYTYTSTTPSEPIGDAMFVAPGETSYPLQVYTSYPQAGYTAAPVDLNITLPEGVKFERGKSYHVTVVIYGLSDIKVYASLTHWIDGDTIPRLNEDILDE